MGDFMIRDINPVERVQEVQDLRGKQLLALSLIITSQWLYGMPCSPGVTLEKRMGDVLLTAAILLLTRNKALQGVAIGSGLVSACCTGSLRLLGGYTQLSTLGFAVVDMIYNANLPQARRG